MQPTTIKAAVFLVGCTRYEQEFREYEKGVKGRKKRKR
jgi:hypothetical protein